MSPFAPSAIAVTASSSFPDQTKKLSPHVSMIFAIFAGLPPASFTP